MNDHASSCCSSSLACPNRLKGSHVREWREVPAKKHARVVPTWTVTWKLSCLCLRDHARICSAKRKMADFLQDKCFSVASKRESQPVGECNLGYSSGYSRARVCGKLRGSGRNCLTLRFGSRFRETTFFPAMNSNRPNRRRPRMSQGCLRLCALIGCFAVSPRSFSSALFLC